MKRILFIIPSYRHGGTNKSLHNLLPLLDKNMYQIHVFSISTIGPYRQILEGFTHIQRSIILSSIYDSFRDIMLEPFFERIKKVFCKSSIKFLRIFIRDYVVHLVYRIESKRLSKMKFDTVIAFQEGLATQFAAHFHSRKIAWVRCDYSEYEKQTRRNEVKIYNRFNQIVCVSDFTMQSFLTYYPSLKEKCLAIHNPIDYQYIKKSAVIDQDLNDQFIPADFTILSVGRLSKVKQFDIIPSIAAKLKQKGYNFMWYIIGEGIERRRIEEMIVKCDIKDNVILLGEIDNPYPYFYRSSLYVLTSLSEACPNVINEAKILSLPVISTNFGSAKEFLTNEIDGIITEKDNLFYYIEKMINDKVLITRIKEKLELLEYSNDEILSQVINIL